MSDFYKDLRDSRVLLTPLTEEGITDLASINSDPGIWTWFSADLSEKETMKSWMRDRLRESQEGTKMSYVVKDAEGNIAGTTSYGNIDWDQKNMEVGWTWLGKKYIGSGINKHMKFLMLSHAFETMGVERMEIRTDEINVRSRRAIEKIGAQLDGVFRCHRWAQGGRRRNTVIYAIVKDDWKEIKSTIFSEF